VPILLSSQLRHGQEITQMPGRLPCPALRVASPTSRASLTYVEAGSGGGSSMGPLPSSSWAGSAPTPRCPWHPLA
jgi:hypothetical protein